MDLFIANDDVVRLIGAAESILKIIGSAQGRADSYAARREEFKVIHFPQLKNAPSGGEVKEKQARDSQTIATGEAPFYFSEEEIKRMPKLKDGHLRKTKDGLYQIRYRREGYDKQFTSKDAQTAKALFREWIQSVSNERKAAQPKKATLFGEFAERYFENVKSTNVSAETYANQYGVLKRHILPKLERLAIRKITPMTCQELLNGILAEGKGRTADSVKTLLGEIFHAAMGEKLITENPMGFVKIPKHQKEHGSALSNREVKEFVSSCEKSYYKKQFMIFLYTGIRRNELRSATFDENFMTIACGKCHKGQRQQYRKIPIAPQLKQYLPLTQKELTSDNKVMTRAFKKICPAHNLYDLRHTFTTRTQECGISKALVDVWTGHVNRSDMTSSVYTHFSDEYQIQEIKKLEY